LFFLKIEKQESDYKLSEALNNIHLLIIAAVTVMLIGATILSTTDSAFAAKKKYEKSQAAAQANYCGNGEAPLNVFCQNLLSQIQGDGNAVNIIGVQ
jgi:hypothetical protein